MGTRPVLDLVGANRQLLIAHIPHARAIGLKVIDVRPDEAWLQVPYAESLVGNPETGVVHGGVITTLLDNAAGTAVILALDEPRSIATLDLRARGTAADYQALLERIPYARFLGIGVDEVGERGVLVRLRFDRRLIGNPTLPAIHGGVIGAFLEFAAILELVRQGEGERLPKPIDLAIDYLRSAGPADAFARATLTKHGRRVANVRVEAWQDSGDRLVGDRLGCGARTFSAAVVPGRETRAPGFTVIALTSAAPSAIHPCDIGARRATAPRRARRCRADPASRASTRRPGSPAPCPRRPGRRSRG